MRPRLTARFTRRKSRVEFHCESCAGRCMAKQSGKSDRHGSLHEPRDASRIASSAKKNNSLLAKTRVAERIE